MSDTREASVPASPFGDAPFQSLKGHLVPPSGVDLHEATLVEGDSGSHSSAPLERLAHHHGCRDVAGADGIRFN